MKDYWDEYNQILANESEEYYLARAKLGINKYLKNIPEGAKILDYGCGLGVNIYLLDNTFGYDPSEYAMNFCKNKGIKTLYFNELEDNSFDVVLCCTSLHFALDPLKELETMYNKLKKGGKIIITIGNYYSGNICKPNNTYRLYDWDIISICNLLCSVGFKILETGKVSARLGEKKLFFLCKHNFKLYEFLTKFFGWFSEYKYGELMITCEK